MIFCAVEDIEKEKIPCIVQVLFARSRQHNFEYHRSKGNNVDRQWWITKTFGFIFSSNTRQQTSKRQGEKAEVPVLDHVLSLIHLPEKEDITNLSQSWVALVVLPHIR